MDTIKLSAISSWSPLVLILLWRAGFPEEIAGNKEGYLLIKMSGLLTYIVVYQALNLNFYYNWLANGRAEIWCKGSIDSGFNGRPFQVENK